MTIVKPVDTTPVKATTTCDSDPIRHLVECVCAGEPVALADLLTKLRPAMEATIKSYLRDYQNGSDCGRDECLAASQEKVSKFLKDYEYRGERSLEGWSREIALNATKDHLRSKWSREKRYGPMPVDADGKEIETTDPLKGSKTVGSEVANDEILNLVRDELRRDRIPDSHKRVLRLRFYENQSYREMGATLGCSHEEANRKLASAIAWVRENLSIVTKLRKAGDSD